MNLKFKTGYIILAILISSNVLSPVVADAAAKTKSRTIPILMYHYIRNYNKKTDRVGINLSVSPRKFDNQMNYLASHGYHTVTPDNIKNNTLPSKPIMITFDDGYRDAYTQAFPVLKKYKFTGVFYIITKSVGYRAYMTWDQIKEMSTAGMYFGSHTLDHASLTRLSSSRLSTELVNSKKMLEQKIGKPITAFCYPYGNLNNNVVNKVAKAGYTTAVTTAGVKANLKGSMLRLSRIRVTNSTKMSF